MICKEQEKSIVLLPCKHLCLCTDCSQHIGGGSGSTGRSSAPRSRTGTGAGNRLTHCPLCREIIIDKISIYL